MMAKAKVPYGRIEVVCGCMFSGKSTELIRRIEVAQHAGQKVQVFNSTLDTEAMEARASPRNPNVLM